MPSSVPTLSARDIDSAAFAAAIGAAYEQSGFVVIAEHGIPDLLIGDCMHCFRNFFALPEAEKRRYVLPGQGGARGYTPFGIETAKGALHHDLKEFWHVGRDLPAGHPFRQYMPDNVWATQIEGFRNSTLQLFDAFDALGRRLLAAIATALALPRSFFDDKVNLGNSVLRVIHYPPLPPHDTPSVRAGAHEDINVITLLLGADEPGLEVLDKQGRWLAVNPPPGSLVCNVGDMLQRLTNNQLRSTSHRVTNPPRERASRSRLSLPYFLHFNPDFLIETLPQCIGPDRPDLYPTPITADEYLQERLREIKLK
ncbi:MAG: 2-oxoglutarate and iron-dependent oxygenase domain-containing protein [Steroidobacteraceae bacterium]